MSETSQIKCVVWDLDDTLWDGVLLEDPSVALRPEVADAIRTLDERGILHSIASRNDHDLAASTLDELGLAEYFLHPQINWGAKSASVAAIAEALNLGLDSLALVDDSPFERDEVSFALPQVRCFDAALAATLPARPELTPPVVTEDARQRRSMYRAEQRRTQREREFTGPTEEFLATLGMRLRIAPAEAADLHRAEELTLRTNQLNTTGYTYSLAELAAFRQDDHHDLLVARLDDRYGGYGTIGLALVERGTETWLLKLLLMSCRVMSRGVGTVMINHIRREATMAGARLRAEFVATGRNRMMYVTYKFCGFREIARDGDHALLEADGSPVPPPPPYLVVEVANRAGAAQ